MAACRGLCTATSSHHHVSPQLQRSRGFLSCTRCHLNFHFLRKDGGLMGFYFSGRTGFHEAPFHCLSRAPLPATSCHEPPTAAISRGGGHRGRNARPPRYLPPARGRCPARPTGCCCACAARWGTASHGRLHVVLLLLVQGWRCWPHPAKGDAGGAPRHAAHG